MTSVQGASPLDLDGLTKGAGDQPDAAIEGGPTPHFSLRKEPKAARLASSRR